MNEPRSLSVTETMASRFAMTPNNFERVLRETVVPKDCSPAQFAAFLLVARDYHLNPITREIFAFPTRGGGIQPIVSIDGWMSIINSHPQMDGMEFEDILDGENQLVGIKCKIYRKDRRHPIEVIEYLSECRRNTDTWRQWPARMLRHKAAIQCARYAFGFSGIVEPDEFERMSDQGQVIRSVPSPKVHRDPAPEIESTPASEPAEDMNANPKTPPYSTQPKPPDVASPAEAYELGRKDRRRNVGKMQWPSWWRDQPNIEAWQEGWDAENADIADNEGRN